jgi:hypothetical protein
MAADDAAMPWAQIVVIDGVARLAGLIQGLAPNRVALAAVFHCRKRTGRYAHAQCQHAGGRAAKISRSFHFYTT